MFVSGVDRCGRPSWTWRCAQHDSSSSMPERGARYLVNILERTWRVNPNAEKMVVICDCSDLQFHNYEHQVWLISAEYYCFPIMCYYVIGV